MKEFTRGSILGSEKRMYSCPKRVREGDEAKKKGEN